MGRHPPSGSVLLYFFDPDGLTVEYGFGTDESPEVGAREPRMLEPVPKSLDTWGAVPDAQFGTNGAIRRAVPPDGTKIALYQVDGRFYATAETCTHGAASLAEDGSVDGHHVECNWHDGRFDIRTGEACAMPCSEALRTWTVEVIDGQVCVLDDHG